jgi:hypothetical protein
MWFNESMPLKMFDDEVVPGVVDFMQYMNQTYNPTREELLEFCADSSILSKRQCYPKVFEGLKFIWVGGNYLPGIPFPDFHMYHNEMPYTYEMPMSAEGYVLYGGAAYLEPYVGGWAMGPAPASYAFKNKYFTRVGGQLVLKDMTAAQIAEKGECVQNIQDHTDSYYIEPLTVENPSPPSYLAQKIWQHTYCTKDGVTTQTTGYINFFLGDTMDGNASVLSVVVPQWDEYELLRAATLEHAIKQGTAKRAWRQGPHLFYTPVKRDGAGLGVEALLCDESGCDHSKFARYRSEWYAGVAGTVAAYRAYGYDLSVPPNTTAY